jgi:hypothetical protein
MVSQLELFTAPAPVVSTEAQEKRRVLADMKKLRAAEIERLRRVIRHLAHSNHIGQRHSIPYTVTSDDLREHEGITREQRKERGRWFVAKNNIIGAAFHNVEFVRVGTVASKWEGSHGREIKLWTLRKYENIVRSFMAAKQ